MTRMLALTMVAVCMACGGDAPLPTKPKPVVDPEPLEPQPNMAEFFAPFKDTLTGEEFEYFLKQIKLSCEGYIGMGAVKARLERKLSIAAFERIYSEHDDIMLYGPNRFTNESRIRIALMSEDSSLKNVSFRFDHAYLQYGTHLYVWNFEIDPMAGGNGGGSSRGDYDEDDIEKIWKIIRQMEKLWQLTGKMQVPPIPHDLDLTLLIVDETGRPIKRGFQHLAIPIDEAPRATVEEYEEWQQKYSPGVYDCVDH